MKQVRAAGFGVNFQVSIMKVLASYPLRLATPAELKRDLAILASSGPDWAESTRRMAAACPDLDIFDLGFVERYSFGWHLTHRGLQALERMENHARVTRTIGQIAG